MSYVAVYNSATTASSNLRKQTTVAIRVAATDVINESDGTTNHPARLAWAIAVQKATDSWVDRMIWSVLENGTIAASPESAVDADVQFVINSLVDSYSKLV